MTHTAGPWKAEYSEMGGYDCMTDAWSVKSSGQFIVATIDLSSYGQTAKEDATSAGRALAEADARLIAAAPDLLAVCKSIRKRWSDEGTYDDDLDDAIAKAEAV